MDEEKILKKIDELQSSFNEFKLNISIDVALIKQQSKTSARIWGLVGGGLPILIGLGAWFLRSLV